MGRQYVRQSSASASRVFCSSFPRLAAERITLQRVVTNSRGLLSPCWPFFHWICSPARMSIPPRRRGQEHTHFARRDEHFDWPGTQAASHCCTGTQSFFRYCLREKNLDTSQRSGRHFGMSDTRAKFNQAAERGCPVCCFEDSCGDGVARLSVNR